MIRDNTVISTGCRNYCDLVIESCWRLSKLLSRRIVDVIKRMKLYNNSEINQILSVDLLVDEVEIELDDVLKTGVDLILKWA